MIYRCFSNLACIITCLEFKSTLSFSRESKHHKSIFSSNVIFQSRKNKWTTSFAVRDDNSNENIPENDENLANDYKNQKELQVLRFKDPKSNRDIILVGCMHYNPTSILLAKKTVDELGSTKNLHSVLIESCPTRSKSAQSFRSSLGKGWQRDLYNKITNNEMTTASNLALQKYGVPVILADQPIEVTMQRIRYYLSNTIKDFMKPHKDGWKNILIDTSKAVQYLSLSLGIQRSNFKGNSSIELLSSKDFLDMNLVANMPFSLLRYPLSIILRNSTSLVAIFLLISVLQQIDILLSSSPTSLLIHSSILNNTPKVPLIDDLTAWFITFLITALQITFFFRALILPILQERDVALARSISDVANDDNIMPFETKFQEDSFLPNLNDDPSSYINNTIDREFGNSKKGAVVAILGMAHCNGVQQLIVNGNLDEY